MVHLRDEGGVFDAPLEVIWAYHQDLAVHAQAHAQQRPTIRAITENQFLISYDQEQGGDRVHVVSRITVLPPTGLAIEIIEGPLAGSKFFNFYTPRGDRTEVTVVGHFVDPKLAEADVPEAVGRFLDEAFLADRAALARRVRVG